MIDRQLPPFVDTNVLVRHLTGDPPAMARKASSFLRSARALLLLDVIVAELAYGLGSVYRQSRADVAMTLRALVGLPQIRVLDAELLHRTFELYEQAGIGFADAYLVASAERSGVKAIVSFDRSIDRVPTVHRLEPV